MLESVSVTPDGGSRRTIWDCGTTTRPRAAADRRLRPCPGHADRHSAGPRRPQGFDVRPGKGTGAVPVEAGGWPTVAPSAKPFGQESIPRALTIEHIAQITTATGAAAERAARLGFDVVEVQAGHGYLLHEFCSPLTNLRDDEYGGSFDKCTRIVRETVDVVRAAWPDDRPLFVRVSSTDWVDGGWTVDDTVALARQCGDQGVDLIDCSSGGLSPGDRGPLPRVRSRLRGPSSTGSEDPSSAVGFITEPAQAELLLAAGGRRCDARSGDAA